MDKSDPQDPKGQNLDGRLDPELLDSIDETKRDLLKKLIYGAFAVPVIASFSMSTLATAQQACGGTGVPCPTATVTPTVTHTPTPKPTHDHDHDRDCREPQPTPTPWDKFGRRRK